MSSQPHRWQIRSTVAILVLSTITTLSGLFRSGHYGDAPGLTASYQIQDLTILVVDVPVLALGLWYATEDLSGAGSSGSVGSRT